MLKVRIFFALGLALLYFAEPYIGLIPLAIWAVAYPAFFIIKNRKGLMYSKKKLFNPDQVARNYEKSFESTYGAKQSDADNVKSKDETARS